jgi:hypothetical protein
MALYSDLVLKLKATLAVDGGSVLIEDNTGTFPESPGGYAPSGSGTLQRPSEDEVNKFLMYRIAPFDPLTENIPSTAIEPPYTFGLLGVNGLPSPDAIYQFVFMVDSIDGDDWNFLVSEAFISGDPWGYLVSYFSDDESGNAVQIGQLGLWANAQGVNCINNVRRELIDEWVAGGCKECDMSSFMLKNAMAQGITSNLILAQTFPIDSQDGNDYYEEAQAEVEFLLNNCSEDCPC